MILPSLPLSIRCARQLVRAAEERVGRRADAQPLLLRALLEVEPFLDRQHERLFRIDVLAGVEHLPRHVVVHRRYRQVDDDVDVVRREQLVDGLGAQLELLGARLRRLHVDVGAGAHLDALEQRRQPEIGGRDVAAADDADAEFLCHVRMPLSSLLGRFDRAPGEALDVARVVVLHDVDLARPLFVAQRLDQSGPVDRAVADIGPAVLVWRSRRPARCP